MQIADLGEVRLHYRIDGDPDGAPVVFANSLGTDLRLWDPVLPLLPKGLKFIRYDKRGHGLSSMPKAPYSMGSLVRDVELLMDHLGVKDSVFVGLSIGGMIAQGLAVKRLDLVKETIDLIPGSQFHLIRGAGHLPCVEKPAEYAEVLSKFFREIGHV